MNVYTLLVAGGVAVVALGGSYIKGRTDGREGEAAVWQARVTEAVGNIQTELEAERARGVAREAENIELNQKVDDYVAQLDAAGAHVLTERDAELLRNIR